jgi:cyclic-di-AMP phosphodiesterase PgpH
MMAARPAARLFFLKILLLLATFTLAYFALVYPTLIGSMQAELQVGQVAVQDIVSPRSITYESEVLTSRQKDTATNLVAPVYTALDTGVARQQVNRLREALAYISAVRSGTFATQENKLDDLAALEDIQLRQETALKIIALTDTRWQAVSQESINVLEQTMRSAIREDRLDEARRSIPARVSLSLPEDQAAIVSEIVMAFVAPNSFFSADLTEQARQQARDAVQPVTRTYLAGETIVQRGRVINEEDLEALGAAGLVETGDPLQEQAGAFAIVLASGVLTVLYLRRRQQIARDLRSLLLLALLFLLFLIPARLLIPGHVVVPYLYPVPALSLTIAALFGAQSALIAALPLAALVTFGLPNALELTLFYIFGAIFGVFGLGHARRLSSFLRASLAIALAGTLIILAYRLAEGSTDWIGLLSLMGAAAFNGAVSAGLTVLLQFFLAQFLGMTTPLQLMELSRPDHPLLQFILRRAPGTYQHSLQVANLAEQAAEQINADALLTRVGALYHDAGKALNPSFFIENQVAYQLNPHDDLDPETSAAIIIRHVTDGVELARKYRLPRRLHDFILEHHGDSITRYQYVNALDAVEGNEALVDAEAFRYPGPKPQTRETAILLLADSSEAVTRAKKPANEADLHSLIKSVIESRLAEGQLDETTLTLQDLHLIHESFTNTLKGLYHPRIEYPALKKVEAPAELPAPVAADEPTRPIDANKVANLSEKTQADPSP